MGAILNLLSKVATCLAPRHAESGRNAEVRGSNNVGILSRSHTATSFTLARRPGIKGCSTVKARRKGHIYRPRAGTARYAHRYPQFAALFYHQTTAISFRMSSLNNSQLAPLSQGQDSQGKTFDEILSEFQPVPVGTHLDAFGNTAVRAFLSSVDNDFDAYQDRHIQYDKMLVTDISVIGEANQPFNPRRIHITGQPPHAGPHVHIIGVNGHTTADGANIAYIINTDFERCTKLFSLVTKDDGTTELQIRQVACLEGLEPLAANPYWYSNASAVEDDPRAAGRSFRRLDIKAPVVRPQWTEYSTGWQKY